MIIFLRYLSPAQVQNILNPDSPVEFDSCIYFFLQRLFIARSHALAASAECEGERLCPVAASRGNLNYQRLSHMMMI